MDSNRIVAVEMNADGRAEIFYRLKDGTVKSQLEDFHPWFLVSGEHLAHSIDNAERVEALSGNGVLNYRVYFANEAAYDLGLKAIKKISGVNASSPLAPYRAFNDWQFQILTHFGVRLFNGMDFGELRRMQLDIETRCSVPGTFCDANRPEDEVFMVSLKDSTGWECCLTTNNCGDEPGLIKKMLEIIQERDPDVIEGHNIFSFDLNYLAIRAKRYKIPLAMGRGGKCVASRASQYTVGDRTNKYTRFDIYGRHVIDTYIVAQLYDMSSRDMDSYGLKPLAKYFGVASPERTYVAGNQITEVFDNNPEILEAYCLDDVRETDAISRIMTPSWFYQTSQIPTSYQNCVVRGNASRVDMMLCAEYLQQGAGLPTAMAMRQYEGALSVAERTGMFHRVWHIDVRSLYPSVIMSGRLSPRSDYLGVFLMLLGRLREFRLEAKDAMRKAESAEQKEYFNALQSSFKILINSFYGYLGFSIGTFNDFDVAEQVTAKGREILISMRNLLENGGAKVVEMDTDGLYFVPPEEVDSTEEMRSRVQAILPSGIEVELDSTYQAMFSYKSKNYALLDEKGKVHLTGASLKSRGMEMFLRRFILDYMELALTGRQLELSGLYEQYCSDIENHRFSLKDICKREILTLDPERYAEKLKKGETKRNAASELALAAGKGRYKANQSIFFYVTGFKKNVVVTDNCRALDESIAEPERDENLAYYLDKLKQIYEKFAEVLQNCE